jgi:uncharacterized metal-binding protein YceD (DUF177 family)
MIRQPFKFETERLRKGPETHQIECEAALVGLTDDPEFKFLEPVHAELTLRMVGTTTVLVQGTVHTIASAPCSRCLEDLRVPLRAKVSLAYMTDDRLRDPLAKEENFDDNTHWYDGESINPAEEMRELLLLELPAIAACELESEDRCPITGKTMGRRTFGPVDDAPAERPNSLAEQLRKLREKKPEA